MRISVLNAGKNTDYLYGFVSGLASIETLSIDVLDSPKSLNLFAKYPNVNHVMLHKDNDANAPIWKKMLRICRYYAALLAYIIRTDSKIFHIQWEAKFVYFDRFILTLLYLALGKKTVITVHNVNIYERDYQKSTYLQRKSLDFKYKNSDLIVVHTSLMKKVLLENFSIDPEKIHVIPHGINNMPYSKNISTLEARKALDISEHHKVLLFFGRLTPYKGMDDLLHALSLILEQDNRYTLVIAGTSQYFPDYLLEIKQLIEELNLSRHVVLRDAFIPHEDVERYFMAADCLILPYTRIDQSGLIFLSYRFGLPIIGTDIGNFREDIVEGVTGFICPPSMPRELGKTVEKYFQSDLSQDLDASRVAIAQYANDKYSWEKIAQQNHRLYERLSKA